MATVQQNRSGNNSAKTCSYTSKHHIIPDFINPSVCLE